MKTTDDAVLRAAGHALKQIRDNEYGYTQRDVSRESRNRWGDEGEIDQAVLSKIERGALAKTLNLTEAARLAVLYNRPLSWMAELYGLPVVHTEIPNEPIANELNRVLSRIPADDPRRQQLVEWVKFAIRQTEAMLEEKGA